MSVLAALVSFDDDALALVNPWPDVQGPIRRAPVDEVRVESVPGGLLAFGAIFADSWRRADRQPFVDSGMQAAVVADCRLDNRDELRTTLSCDRTCSDAALLLQAYERWGAAMASHLLGDFAIVIWDWRRSRVVVVRDHVGIKPVYYWTRGRELMVATDLNVLIQLANPSPVPDDQFILEHLLMEYRSTDRTFWDQIKRLPGGHSLTVGKGGAEVSRYWFPPLDEAKQSSTEEVHEDLRRLFFAAVERRLDSDSPLVAHLSGGLDSSGVVCVAEEIYRRSNSRPPLTTASALYPELECDESEFINAVVDQVSFKSETWDARGEGMSPLTRPSLMGPGMGANPMGDMTLGGRIGAKALLAGHGGDFVCWAGGVSEDVARARPTRDVLGRILGPGVPIALRAARLRSLVRRNAPLSFRRLAGNVRARWYAPRWLNPIWHGVAAQLAVAGYPSETAATMSRVKVRHWEGLSDGSLGLSLDNEQLRATAAGLEIRCPFLDVQFVEYVLSIPFRHWPPVTPYARLHREFLAQYLPKPVLRRSKMTFSVGVAYRMKLAWPRIRSLFFDGPWYAGRYVNRLAAQVLISQGEAGATGNDWPLWRGIWGIATLEAWLRRISGYSNGAKRRADADRT